MQEIITFTLAADWITKLAKKMGQIRKQYKQELLLMGDTFSPPDEISQCYIEPDCQNINPAEKDEDGPATDIRKPVFEVISAFLKDGVVVRNGASHMFILSAAGMGKTSLMMMTKLAHLGKFWPSGFDFVLLKLGEETLKTIHAISGKSNTILLLDSLDEDPTAWSDVQKRLLELLAATQKFHRVIITCRTQFFPTAKSDIYERPGFVEVGKGYSCPSVYLSLFSDKQVDAYLSKRFPRTFGQWLIHREHPKYKKAHDLIRLMKSLRLRPMLLANIEDIMNGGRECRTEYDMYDVLIQEWLKREERKAFDRGKDLEAATLEAACISLALDLQREGKRFLPNERLSELCKETPCLTSLEEIDICGRSLMDCTSLGDYRFAHFSFQEFLVAKAIVEQQCVEALRDVRITAFLFTMFLQAVERSYTRIGDEKISPIQLKSMQFRGLELEGMTLKNICFEECDFSRASIRNSLIQDCFFKRSNLGRADFTGSRFKAVAFEAVSLEDTVLESSEALCKYAGKSNIALYISAGGNELVRIPGGEFLMGEGDQHEVRINDFYLGRYPVTNEEFGRFLETNLKANKPGYWRDPKYNQPNQPVVGVSWDEARAYCEWAGLRLPSEAEWEYACRAGTTSRFWSGDTDEDLARVGWYLGNSDNWIHAVGEKEPNPFGLFDMHGNVWEWVEDDWHGDYNGAPTDGSAWEDKQRAGYRVYRGGSFGNVAGYCQSAVRRYVHLGRRSRHLGFRPARSIP